MPARPKLVNLYDSLSKSLGLKKKESEQRVNAVFEEIVNLLSEGNDVRVGNFGTFKVSVRKEYMGRNPRTGEAILIPEKRIVSYHPSKNMMERATEKALFDESPDTFSDDKEEPKKKVVTEPNLHGEKGKAKPVVKSNSFEEF